MLMIDEGNEEHKELQFSDQIDIDEDSNIF